MQSCKASNSLPPLAKRVKGWAFPHSIASVSTVRTKGSLTVALWIVCKLSSISEPQSDEVAAASASAPMREVNALMLATDAVNDMVDYRTPCCLALIV